METKWIVIMVMTLVVVMFVPLAITEYSNGQCRIEAIKAGVEADRIKTACGIR